MAGRCTTSFRRCWLAGTRRRDACGHHKARLYHIHYKPLYRAIGEPNNRHRRPTALPRAIERLMLLDAVLADRERTWLATEQRQARLFHAHASRPTAGSPVADVPRGGCRDGPVLPEKLPIGLDPDGRTHIFLYPADAGCAD